MINSLTIQDFRGIHALSIPALNRINLIVGDNNCGKTSVLEAILLLRNPGDLSNLFRVAKLRDASVFFSGITLYENFTYMFPQKEAHLSISVSATCDGSPVECSISGEKISVPYKYSPHFDLSLSKRPFTFSTGPYQSINLCANLPEPKT